MSSPIDLPPEQGAIIRLIVTRFNGAIQRGPWRVVSTEGLRAILPSSATDVSNRRDDIRKRYFEQSAHRQEEQQRVNDQPEGDILNAVEQKLETDDEHP